MIGPSATLQVASELPHSSINTAQVSLDFWCAISTVILRQQASLSGVETLSPAGDSDIMKLVNPPSTLAYLITQASRDVEVTILSRDIGTSTRDGSKCDEFQSVSCHELSVGAYTHKYVSIAPYRQVSLKIRLSSNFDWGTGNAIQLHIEHDNHQMANSFVFIQKPNASSLKVPRTL